MGHGPVGENDSRNPQGLQLRLIHLGLDEQLSAVQRVNEVPQADSVVRVFFIEGLALSTYDLDELVSGLLEPFVSVIVIPDFGFCPNVGQEPVTLAVSEAELDSNVHSCCGEDSYDFLDLGWC